MDEDRYLKELWVLYEKAKAAESIGIALALLDRIHALEPKSEPKTS